MIDAHPDLDAEDVVRRTGKFRVLPDVAAEVEDVNQVEVHFQFLPHSVKSFLRDEAVVVHEADDAASGLRQTVCNISSLARARFTFSKMSDALAVQIKGRGF